MSNLDCLLARVDRICELLASNPPEEVTRVLSNRLFCLCHIIEFYYQ
jgi:hypothetical protein